VEITNLSHVKTRKAHYFKLDAGTMTSGYCLSHEKAMEVLIDRIMVAHYAGKLSLSVSEVKVVDVK